MADFYKQGTRPMMVTTPLGPDKLLLVGFQGSEEISGLFSFKLDLIAPIGSRIAFDKLLGEPMTVAIRILDGSAGGAPKFRYFSGICRTFSQGNSDETFTSYGAEIVPQFWLTTRRAQSRIFQQMSVPEILKKVLTGFDVDHQTDGNFEKREYSVQYRETDFNFACRLMEEEGIFYFFRHTDSGHTMVIANSPRIHADVPGPAKVQWDVVEGADRKGHNIHEWVKRQEVRSGKFTVWDHSFEFPGNSLEASKSTLDSVAVGKVQQKLGVANNTQLEIYDYPGEYAKWFDGVDKGGGDQPAELKKIFDESTRTAALRIEAETCAGLRIHGSSNCPHFVNGHKFTLERHPDAEGAYVLTSVHHHATGGNAYRTGSEEPFVYSNSFTCIPLALPFRPQRLTPKPVITGVQTATVTGPHGEEIFVDKHARVKVQFPWDREGKHDAHSSCWIRVSQAWGGGSFGGMAIPRIGHEVIVSFVEGDPDRPLITGCVYNAKNMPHASNAGRKTPGPASMKDAAMMTSFKSNSTPGGGGHNEITMNDTAGAEGLFIKAQKDEIHLVGNDQTNSIGNNRTTEVKVDSGEKIGNNMGVEVGVNAHEKVGAAKCIDVGTDLLITAGTSITLKCGAGTIHMNQAGLISISGTIVLVAGAITADVTAPITTISGLALLQTGVISVNAGVFTNIVGGVTVIDGNPVKIN